MSTSEYKSVAAEGDLPISEAELAALASQLFASARPGPDSPPQTTAVAPRGNVPDTTAVTSAAATAAGTADPVSPSAQFVSVPSVTIPAPTSPGPDPIPPQTVPVAPRGNVPDTTAAPSAGHTAAGGADPFLVPGVSGLEAFAVPSGIVSTVPGVLAGTVP